MPVACNGVLNHLGVHQDNRTYNDVKFGIRNKGEKLGPLDVSTTLKL